ncbi:hypothetical protein E2C01_098740 [Portunus trituberculatus]|uniref:Uncharacterized protein n=1 Tax=Portunus trituberculatus TaxID=210409 RepID=A0A5B7KDM4_PORTR|nr:hypothetical protein [Portunus trituberculatus]
MMFNLGHGVTSHASTVTLPDAKNSKVRRSAADITGRNGLRC